MRTYEAPGEKHMSASTNKKEWLAPSQLCNRSRKQRAKWILSFFCFKANTRVSKSGSVKKATASALIDWDQLCASFKVGKREQKWNLWVKNGGEYLNQTKEEKEQKSARLELNCQKQCLDEEGIMSRNAVNHHQGQIQAFCFIFWERPSATVKKKKKKPQGF